MLIVSLRDANQNPAGFGIITRDCNDQRMQRMRIEELLASIERGCKQLSDMIDAILTCSRLMRGRMEPVNLDLNCKYDVQIENPRLLIPCN